MMNVFYVVSSERQAYLEPGCSKWREEEMMKGGTKMMLFLMHL